MQLQLFQKYNHTEEWRNWPNSYPALPYKANPSTACDPTWSATSPPFPSDQPPGRPGHTWRTHCPDRWSCLRGNPSLPQFYPIIQFDYFCSCPFCRMPLRRRRAVWCSSGRRGWGPRGDRNWGERGRLLRVIWGILVFWVWVCGRLWWGGIRDYGWGVLWRRDEEGWVDCFGLDCDLFRACPLWMNCAELRQSGNASSAVLKCYRLGNN